MFLSVYLFHLPLGKVDVEYQIPGFPKNRGFPF